MPNITRSTGDDWPTHRVIFSAHEPHIIVVAPDYGLNADQTRELAAALLAARRRA
jgi:hypothetical protein